MHKYKVSATTCKLNCLRGRIVEATVKAVIEAKNGVRLQVSFGEETSRIYEWQIVMPAHKLSLTILFPLTGRSRLPAK